MRKREYKHSDARFYVFAQKSGSKKTFRRETDGRSFLFIDASYLSYPKKPNGIARAAQKITLALLNDPKSDFVVVPIRFDSIGKVWRSLSLSDLPNSNYFGQDLKVVFSPGDIFLGLDYNFRGTHPYVVAALKEKGVHLAFIVHDIIPLRMPDLYEKKQPDQYQSWLRSLLKYGDQLICISNSTANDVRAWIFENNISTSVDICSIRLGSDFGTMDPSIDLVKKQRKHSEILMVGTVEPRKGYSTALDAFEVLWKNGNHINLKIIGRKGWMVEELAQRLIHQSKFGQLQWLQSASDQELEHAYTTSTGLLAASLAEGFGLPLVEAVHFGCPVLARDIPVFREIAGNQATFFREDKPASLAATIKAFVRASIEVPSKQPPELTTWKDCAATLAQELLRSSAR